MSARPQYERPEDRATQLRIAKAVALRWRVTARELRRFHPLDFALIAPGGLVRAWLEAKGRDMRHDRYEEVMLSLQKLCAGLQFARDTSTQFYFAVEFTDGIFWHQIDKYMPYPVRIMGRTDRNDPQDIEPVAMLPADGFHPLAEVLP